MAVAKLAELVGLQRAMLLAPACYAVSGLVFLLAEKEIEAQAQAQRAQEQEQAQQAAAAQQKVLVR